MLKPLSRVYKTSLKVAVLDQTGASRGGAAENGNRLKILVSESKARFILLRTYASTLFSFQRVHRTLKPLMLSLKDLMSTCRTRNGAPACINCNTLTQRTWPLLSITSTKVAPTTVGTSSFSSLSGSAIKHKVHWRVTSLLKRIPRLMLSSFQLPHNVTSSSSRSLSTPWMSLRRKDRRKLRGQFALSMAVLSSSS